MFGRQRVILSVKFDDVMLAEDLKRRLARARAERMQAARERGGGYEWDDERAALVTDTEKERADKRKAEAKRLQEEAELKELGRCKSENAAAVYEQLGAAKAEESGHVYYPNRFCKEYCGEAPACNGEAADCPFHNGKIASNPHGESKCWRVSFKTMLKKLKEEGGVFLQVVEENGLAPGSRRSALGRWRLVSRPGIAMVI